MRKTLAFVVASIFTLGTVAAYGYKLEPLSKEERSEMRARADRLVAERDRDTHEHAATHKESKEKSKERHERHSKEMNKY